MSDSAIGFKVKFGTTRLQITTRYTKTVCVLKQVNGRKSVYLGHIDREGKKNLDNYVTYLVNDTVGGVRFEACDIYFNLLNF